MSGGGIEDLNDFVSTSVFAWVQLPIHGAKARSAPRGQSHAADGRIAQGDAYQCREFARVGSRQALSLQNLAGSIARGTPCSTSALEYPYPNNQKLPAAPNLN